MHPIELNFDAVKTLLPKRLPIYHKGDCGKILMLCGSVGYTGAPALAAMGALRCGAGLVYLGVPKEIYDIEAVKLLEPVVFPLADCDGMLSTDAITEIESRLKGMDALLIGPGIGKSVGAEEVLKFVLAQFDGPVVVDADGINLLGKHKDIVRGRTKPTILTPHSGEFQRIGYLSDNRVDSAVQLAKDLGCIVVLKGHESVTTDGRTVYLNKTGNPGMAVGGSGDVLAGIILALLGQKMDPLLAAACGVWLHGAAGDLCEKEMGQYSMLPSDILMALPRLLK